jgi:hypothetical protein
MARIISSTAGTRTEPKDGYVFIRGTTASFKMIFTNNGVPTKVDTATQPKILIIAPKFLDDGTPQPNVLAEIIGDLTPGQEFEYKFDWNIPVNQFPLDNYVVSYFGHLGGVQYNFGDEYFTVSTHAGVIGTKQPSYATVDDVRKHKFNIDSYLPEAFRKDLDSRNQLIEEHLQNATTRLREELNLSQARGMSENYRLFAIYYTIWSIMLAARGEDGSSVSDSNLTTWRAEWERILAQEKREGVFQGIPVGRG